VVARGHGAFVRGRDATSNVAEYLALIEGLDALIDLGAKEEPVMIRGDAQTIIDQMRGISMVNSPSIKPLFRKAKRLSRRFINLSWIWTPRQQNKEADLLTRKAMQQARSDSKFYQAAIRDIDQGSGDRRKSSKLHSLVDLRVFQPEPVFIPVRIATHPFRRSSRF
jgi:ribonuclease HI